jgi:hypothetical protein
VEPTATVQVQFAAGAELHDKLERLATLGAHAPVGARSRRNLVPGGTLDAGEPPFTVAASLTVTDDAVDNLGVPNTASRKLLTGLADVCGHFE